MKASRLIIGSIILAQAGALPAQTVMMRKAISTVRGQSEVGPSPTPTPTPTPTAPSTPVPTPTPTAVPTPVPTPTPSPETYEWVRTTYTQTPGCGTTTGQYALECRSSKGVPAADDKCSAVRPITTVTVSDFTACTHSWMTDSWDPLRSECSGSYVQQATPYCMRSDGQQVATGCADPAPTAPSRTVANYTGCQGPFTWRQTGWTTTPSCGPSTDVATYECFSQGSSKVVGDSLCAGTKPNETRQSPNYEACGYSWQNDAWEALVPACSDSYVQKTAPYCLRSDGTNVELGKCNPATKPAQQTRTVSNRTSCAFDYRTYQTTLESSTCNASTVVRVDTACYEIATGVYKSFAGSPCTLTKPAARTKTAACSIAPADFVALPATTGNYGADVPYVVTQGHATLEEATNAVLALCRETYAAGDNASNTCFLNYTRWYPGKNITITWGGLPSKTKKYTDPQYALGVGSASFQSYGNSVRVGDRTAYALFRKSDMEGPTDFCGTQKTLNGVPGVVSICR